MPDVSHQPPAVNAVTILWIDDDSDYLRLVAEALESTRDVELIEASDAATASSHLGDVDGVVTTLDLPGRSGASVLDDVRGRDSSLPVVLHTTTALEDVDEEVLSAPAVDYVRKDWDESTVRLTARRVASLVERKAYRETASRLSAAIDACRDPVLVVDGDDTIQFANGQFAAAVSPARTDLCGRTWTELFTDDSIEQLQQEAIPVGAEGWTWSGRTVLAAGPDTEVTARTTLVQLEDGSKVFAFDDLDHPT